MAASPDFTSVRASPAWRAKLASFWRWWTGELGRLVPERFAMLRGAARAPMLAVEGDAAVLIEPRTGGAAEETRVELAGLDDARRKAAVRGLLEHAGETRGRARVVLAHGEALVRRVTMPAATEENLRQVLAFEMDRLTPFRADDVYFDYRVISRDAATGQILVQLAVARRDLIDARAERLRALGTSVQGVAIREDAAHAGTPLDLLPSEQRGERESSRERLVQNALVVTVLALIAVALLLPVWQKRETVVALNPILNKARGEAEATDRISRELERQVADYNFLLAKKHGVYPALAFIEEISRLLPDHTWLQQFDLKTVGKTREVQLTGETVSSSKLIEILEQSTLLQNASPRGTEVRGSQAGTVRFMIGAETRPRAQPEARPVMEMAASIPATPPAPIAPPPAAAPAPAPPTATLTPVPPAPGFPGAVGGTPAGPAGARPPPPPSPQPSALPKGATPPGK